MRCTSYYMLGTPFSSLKLFVAFSAFIASAVFCSLGGGGGGVFVLNEWLYCNVRKVRLNISGIHLVFSWSESRISDCEQFASRTGEVCMILNQVCVELNTNSSMNSFVQCA